jgi:hypothetical protein
MKMVIYNLSTHRFLFKIIIDKFGTKIDWKNVIKLMLKMIKKVAFINCKIGGLKIIKKRSKRPLINLIKIDPKLLKIWYATGGVKIVKNRPRGPGPPKTEFFEILQFSTKAPPLFDPKNDPYKAHKKKALPTKKDVLSAKWGSENATFGGVGGRTARTEKCRHYYIAKTGNRGPKIDQNYRKSTPATSARYR